MWSTSSWNPSSTSLLYNPILIITIQISSNIDNLMIHYHLPVFCQCLYRVNSPHWWSHQGYDGDQWIWNWWIFEVSELVESIVPVLTTLSLLWYIYLLQSHMVSIWLVAPVNYVINQYDWKKYEFSRSNIYIPLKHQKLQDIYFELDYNYSKKNQSQYVKWYCSSLPAFELREDNRFNLFQNCPLIDAI